jgi:hypothetical protein
VRHGLNSRYSGLLKEHSEARAEFTFFRTRYSGFKMEHSEARAEFALFRTSEGIQ